MKYISFFIIFSINIFAQCSDAGVCSVGDTDNDSDASIGLAYFYGYSGKDDDVIFHSVVLSGDVRIIEGTGIYASIPFSSQKGPLGSVSGIGDLLLLLKQDVYESDNFKAAVQAGVKLATGDDNKSDLPQIYQSSLGTNDLLAGFLLSYYNFNFGAAYQLAGSRNSNVLQLERGDDLLIRGGYRFLLPEDITASIELLSINRLEKSTILAPDGESFVEVPESNTPQINLTGQIVYPLTGQIDVNLFTAIPLRNRPVNIDGLKRSLTLSAGINIKI
jgi:hypothetical protein